MPIGEVKEDNGVGTGVFGSDALVAVLPSPRSQSLSISMYITLTKTISLRLTLVLTLFVRATLDTLLAFLTDGVYARGSNTILDTPGTRAGIVTLLARLLAVH